MQTLAPFGFRPLYHPSGLIRPRMLQVVDATQAAYGTALYTGAPVVWNTNGSLNVAAAGADWLGVLAGVEYYDAYGKPTKASFLPATPTGITNVTFYVYDDPKIVYEVQCSTSLTSPVAIGDELTTFDATYTASSGNSTVGTSTAAFSGTLAGAGAQGMARVLGLSLYVDNAWADTYPIVQVENARPQSVSAKVAV